MGRNVYARPVLVIDFELMDIMRHVSLSFLSLFQSSSVPALPTPWLCRAGFPPHFYVARLPAGPSEDYKRRGQDFKGGLHGANGDGLGGVGGVAQTAPQVLKHLPMEHGRLCLTGDLMQPARDTTGTTQQRDMKEMQINEKRRGEEEEKKRKTKGGN